MVCSVAAWRLRQVIPWQAGNGSKRFTVRGGCSRMLLLGLATRLSERASGPRFSTPPCCGRRSARSGGPSLCCAILLRAKPSTDIAGHPLGGPVVHRDVSMPAYACEFPRGSAHSKHLFAGRGQVFGKPITCLRPGGNIGSPTWLEGVSLPATAHQMEEHPSGTMGDGHEPVEIFLPKFGSARMRRLCP